MENKMNKYKIRIGKILLNESNEFIIESTEGQKFTSKITRGSVNFRIYNENMKEINLSNIEEDDIITIYGIIKKEQSESIFKKEVKMEADNLLKLLGACPGKPGPLNPLREFEAPREKDKNLIKKNNIIIKKIIIKNKYNFNLESSEEITDSE
jgi:hypothetical protein